MAYSHANAALIDAVSVVVDNEPITIYEIYAVSKQFNLQIKEALEILIRQKLELSQIKTMNIQISEYDINRQINEISAKNGLGVQSFYDLLKKEGITPEIYKEELKQKMQQEKLYQYILSNKFQAIDEDELLLYYNKNQKEFTKFDSFDVVRFESKNSDDLTEISLKSQKSTESSSVDAKNDFNIANKSVVVATQNIKTSSSDPKVVAALSQTNTNSLTPVIQTRNGFVRFFVSAKNNQTILPFDQVKNFIISKISSKQENDILKEYFDTLKTRATITIIRLP
ncbi:MAG: peptidyl-prolyl cis-trans isomerase [Campylobacteraceae bacterium]|jgi:parvulin-like peptidyl-prolyl isomerase|nr:peptidyl-prolyl cis-trans isomerase [Campylobacteraceae bacterium]